MRMCNIQISIHFMFNFEIIWFYIFAVVSLFALTNAGILLGGGIRGGFGGSLGYAGNEIATGGIGYGGAYGSHAVDYYVSIFMIDKRKITIVLGCLK